MIGKPLNALAFLCALLLASHARASDFRLGLSLGYGGAGIERPQDLTDDDTVNPITVKRASGPGTASVFVDYLLTNRIGLSLEHVRGFDLGPFKSGVTFTGLAGRYYFWPAQTYGPSRSTQSTLIVRRFALFAGGGAGVATGKVTLEGDQVPELSGSGVYFGAKVGAEYMLRPNIGLRPEIGYAMTLFSATQTSLKQLSVQCGIFFFL